jgi:hypothetical protein
MHFQCVQKRMRSIVSMVSKSTLWPWFSNSSIEAEIHQSQPSCATPAIVHVFMPSHAANIFSNMPVLTLVDACCLPI